MHPREPGTPPIALIIPIFQIRGGRLKEADVSK